MYYVYEKGELNRKGGEGAEYKTIVITATVQWAEGDAGKLWYLMHFTATCSPSGLTNAIAKQPLSHTTDERLEVEIPRKWAWQLSYFKICWEDWKSKEKQRAHMWKLNICPAHGNPWSAQPGPGQVPLRRTDRKCGRSKKLGPACLPRNARNDSTVFRNSFGSIYALWLIS